MRKNPLLMPPGGTALLRRTILSALAILALGVCAGCTSIVEPGRVGLLAPFEGLYRQSGYNALAAMRGVTDADTGRYVPVALDNSRGSERSAYKLLAPGNTSAIVGPLTPADAADAYPALLGVDIRWLLPFAQVAGAPVAVDSPDWLAALIGAVAADAAGDARVSRITIAGYEPIFTMIDRQEVEALLADRATLPISWVTQPDAVAQGDLLLWLGDAARGVRFVVQARAVQPALPVWLPIWAANEVFVAHANAVAGWDWENVQWGGWLPADGWSPDSITPAIAEGMQVAASTRHAIAYAEFTSGDWLFATFPLLPE